MSIATWVIRSRQDGVWLASQYATSSAVRPSDLAEHALPAGQVGESDMPPVGEHPGLRRLATRRVGLDGLGGRRDGGPAASRFGGRRCGNAVRGPPARPASAGLVDPEHVHRR
ncbi:MULTISPECIES: hypothetical protein [Frankia]|uniref:hypothetical protein n=1 Tax=Frankia TaxID=1854 RepID=UPI000569C51C|nr:MULTISPECIES: hypothetical protein [Frankia]